MAEQKKKVATAASTSSDAATTEPPSGWAPTPAAKKRATLFRGIAAGLWALAIAGEAVAIFWLLRQREFVGEDGALVRDPDTGLLREQGVTAQFPQWAFVALLIALVLIEANANFPFGGTSILIMVGVALDTVKQIESQLHQRHYEGFLK